MKKTFVFIFLLFSISLLSQENISKKSKFGILVDANASNASIQPVDFSTIGLFDELTNVKSSTAAGFSLGILYRYQLTPFLAARGQGILSFQENKLFYDLKSTDDVTRKREMTRVEFPVHLVFEQHEKQVAPSAFFGAKYSYDIADNAENSNSIANFRSDDIFVDVGVGIAFKLKHFHFKPELVYSRGILNQVTDESTVPLDNALESVYNNQFSLRFLFYN